MNNAFYLFKYIILAQVFVYMEAGVVPSLLEQFTITFHLTPQLQGLLGAVVYIAISFASPVCAYLFRTQHPKIVLGHSLVINAICLLLFAFTPVGYPSLLILFRFGIGFTQAFLTVYSPLWVHEFAPKCKRAQWMSYIQASIPVGITLGYFIGSIAVWCSTHGCYLLLCWRWPLLFPVLFVAPFAVLTFSIPDQHVQTDSLKRRKSIVIVDEDEDDLRDDIFESAVGDERVPNSEKTPLVNSLRTRTSSVFWSDDDKNGVVKLLQTPVFVFVVLGLSALFFVVTGIQYWVTLFLTTNTNNSTYVVHIAYLFVSGTGPVLGVFFGGWLIDKYGGYSGMDCEARALKICIVLGFIAFLAAIPPSFLHDTYSIAVFLWIMLFCGGSILPACSGIVISSAPSPLRPLASSMASTSYNLLGYAASNYLPGVIMSLLMVGDKNGNLDYAYMYRIGFRVVLMWSIWSFLFIFLAYRYSNARVLQQRTRA